MLNAYLYMRIIFRIKIVYTAVNGARHLQNNARSLSMKQKEWNP